VDNQQKLGKEIQIRVNQFKVTQWPQKTVYQYDVSDHHYTDPHSFRLQFHSRFTLAMVLRNVASSMPFGSRRNCRGYCKALIACGSLMATRLHGKLNFNDLG
jgi:hypothetical protein